MAFSQKVKPVFATVLGCVLLAAVSSSPVAGQTPAPVETAAPQAAAPTDPASPAPASQGTPAPTAPGEAQKRILGVLPNYRTAEMTKVYTPIPASYKMKIAVKDSFDYPLVGVAAIYSLFYQLENTHPQFGQGLQGYGKRLGFSYTDQVIGNMLAEGVLPSLFHEDPRYFRMNEGKASKRLLYAISRIVITRTDSGAKTFNFAEVVGNGMAAGIGLSYYTDARYPGAYFQNWATQLGTDALSQVLREFWPDVKRWHARRRAEKQAQRQQQQQP